MRFPYPARKGQEELISWVKEAIERGGHLVVEAGTGTGKTVSALFPSLIKALDSGLRVLYLTRTNSQQTQVMRELRAIKEENRLAVYGIAMQGRSNMCPLAMEDEELRQGNAEELAKLCSDRKKRVLGGEIKACPYYARILEYDMENLRRWVFEEVPDAARFTAYCIKEGICPYEANKALMSGAILVSAPYIYFFEANIRRALLTWMGASIGDLIVIVDEAHNLPEYAREMVSARLSMRSLAYAAGEMDRFGNPEVLDGIAVSDVLDSVRSAITSIAGEYIPEREEDSFVPERAFETEMMASLGISSIKLDRIASGLMNFGDMIKEKKKEEGKLPRSYLYILGDFISFWAHLEANEYIKLVKGGDNPKLEAYCMDASLATDALNNVHSSIHMSGTLEPLEEYRDTIGLSFDTELRRAESPFPPENRLLLYSASATTRYEDMRRNPANISVLEDMALEIASFPGKNAAVFFPSFSMMDRFMADGWHMRTGKKVYIEERKLGGSELMERVDGFRRQKGAVLMAVMGGRISEGIDFPSESLEIAVIVGIPYPKPTAKQRAMQRYYDMKFGKGWEYTVKAPTTRKLLQAIGRLIRSEDDRGAAVILDRRAVQFKESIPAKESDNPLREVEAFFGNTLK